MLNALHNNLLTDIFMRRPNNEDKIERNLAEALADVPIDNKQERDKIRARLRQKYTELQLVKAAMNPKDRRQFEELGKLIDVLEACENRPPKTRS